MGTWHLLWMIAAYSAFASCLYAVYRIWTADPVEGVRQLLILLGFAVLYWLLESWAFYRTPYYYYLPGFPDMVAHFDWTNVSWFPGPVASACDNRMPTLDFGISRTIPLTAAALTFSVMWTARLLRAPPAVQPFLGGLVFLVVDAFLDPVLAKSYDCSSSGPGILPNGAGLEFWRWEVFPALGHWWFGVPLYNYASWFAAPVALIALANVIDWLVRFYAWVTHPTASPPPMPSLLELALLLILFFAFLVIFAVAPTSTLPVVQQALFLVVAIVASLAVVLTAAGSFHTGNAMRWELVYPQLVCAVFPLAAFLLTGLVTAVPYLWIVPIVTVPLMVLWALSPYLGP